MIKTFLIATALTSLVAAPALATDIKIQDFVGKITIVQGNDGVEVTDAGSKGGLDFSDGRSGINIDGGLSESQRNKACNGGGMSFNLDWNGNQKSGDTRLKDYPKLRISVPAGSNLTVEDSSVYIIAEVDLDTADLDLSGCFDVILADVNSIELDKSGSGDVSAQKVGSLIGDKSGSGDIELDEVDVFDLEQSGSGDIEIDVVTGQFDLEKSGSGDVEIDSIEGDLTVEKSGSGDIEVDRGDIPNLSIQNSGSGDVDINAAVGNAVIRSSGSGDVYLESVSGSLDQQSSGSSDFRRGDD